MVPGVYLLPGQISIVSFSEHCLFMLLLSVTSILTYGVSVPLVWWSSWWKVFCLLELREMVLLWSEFFSSISLHMLILLLSLQALVWQSSCLIVRFWFCCNWENGKLQGVVVKFSARGSISYICDAQWSVVFGLWFILLPLLFHAATSSPICSCSPLFDTVLVTFFLYWTLLAVFEKLSFSVDNAVGHSPCEQIQPVWKLCFFAACLYTN